jgi:hypothetical protein
LNDLAVASRLSFFLWSSIPDEELLNLAANGKLKEAAVLERQVKRMLADPRSNALFRISRSNGSFFAISRALLRIWKRSPILTTTFARR